MGPLKRLHKVLVSTMVAVLPSACNSEIRSGKSNQVGAVKVAEVVPTSDGVLLTWSSVANASTYEVVVSSEPDCSVVLAKKTTSETKITLEPAFGSAFYVCIEPYTEQGDLIASAVVTGVAVSYSSPTPAKFSTAGCIDPDLSKILKGQSLTLCDGTMAEGTASVPNLANLTAGNVKTGVSIAGITGTSNGSGMTPCTAAGQTGCLASQSFPSASADLAGAYNLRSSGAQGSGKLKYCRAGYDLSVMDLPDAYANMSFYGRTFTAADATDLLTVTAKTFMQALGTVPVQVSSSGTLPGGLTAGTTYYTIWVTDSTIKLALTMNDALAGTAVDLTSAGTGTHRIKSAGDGVAQYWDVMDDFNSVSSTRGPWYSQSVFGPEYLCEASDWQILAPSPDGTAVVAGAASACDATDDDCMIQDKMTKQIWTEVNPGGGGSSLTWAESIRFCDSLVFGGYSDWRLPIQEEFLQANINGLYMFPTDYPSSGGAALFFRTATMAAVSYNNTDSQAMWIHGNSGSQAENQTNKTQYGSPYALRCVRN